MSKKKTTKPRRARSPTPTQVKKDAKGRFWLVPKDGGAEQGPFDTKKEALDAKAALRCDGQRRQGGGEARQGEEGQGAQGQEGLGDRRGGAGPGHQQGADELQSR